MPGIFGLIDLTGKTVGKDGTSHEDTIAVMAEVMHYEPSYACRMYHNQQLGIYIGWVGDASKVGMNGPIEDPIGGFVLFPSGIPDFTMTRQGCLRKENMIGPWTLEPNQSNGDKFPGYGDGLFAGCLVDERHEQCYLFNDRFGIERIFTYEDEKRIIFSSEAKAILAVVAETRCFDPEGIGQYLTCGCTLGAKSLYRKIRVLLPGTVVHYVKGRPLRVLKSADEPERDGAEHSREPEFLDAFCDTLRTILKGYKRLPLRIAVSLTGGLDSRMIMACLEAPEGAVPSYTFGSMYRDTYDVSIARDVARSCRQPHHVLTLDGAFLSRIHDYMNQSVFISDGYLGLSGAAELYLNRLAKSMAPLRITGNYGGELLRGVRAFRRLIPRGDFLKKDFRTVAEKTESAFHGATDANSDRSSIYELISAGYGRYAIERSQVTVLSPFLDARMVKLIDLMPHRFRGGNELSLRVIQKCRPSLCAIATDRGLLGREHGPEGTARRLYREALFRLEYWTGQGLPDWMSRFSRFGVDVAYEKLFRGRHKFQHYRTWIQNDIAAYVEAVLLGVGPSTLSENMEASRIQEMLIDHRAGRRNFTEEIDRIMTLVLAERLLLKSSIRRPLHGGGPLMQMPFTPGTGTRTYSRSGNP